MSPATHAVKSGVDVDGAGTEQNFRIASFFLAFRSSHPLLHHIRHHTPPAPLLEERRWPRCVEDAAEELFDLHAYPHAKSPGKITAGGATNIVLETMGMMKKEILWRDGRTRLGCM